MESALNEKYGSLIKRIKGLNKIVIGFSGGIDSTLVLKAAIDSLGCENVWAVTGDSESLMPEELSECKTLVTALGLGAKNFIEIKTGELSDPNYRKNPIERCFYCKTELYGKLLKIAREVGASHVVDGSNADDLKDWRPGRKAARDLEIVSPLAESGIRKDEIREIARELGLPNWEKPALACLASRIPYGSEVTEEKLRQIAEAERFIKSLGFSQLRVRHHGKMARIEFLKDDINKVLENGLSEKINNKLKSIGFSYVTVDLQGYRSGSMNENINKDGN